MQRYTEAATGLEAIVRGWIAEAVGGSGSAAGGMAIHALDGPSHTGLLSAAQAPWAATKTDIIAHAGNASAHHSPVTAGDGMSVTGQQVAVNNTVVRTSRQVLAGNGLTGGGALSSDVSLNVGAGTLIAVAADTVGLANGSAQYQVPVTGASPYTPAYTALSTFAGSGLTFVSGAFAVGAGDGITVAADTVALTTPGGLTAATTNSAAGSHTHAIATAAAVGLSAATTNAAGTSTNLVRADHTHAIATGSASTLNVASTNTTGTSANLARADHTHAITSSSDPGAAARLLASDASGFLTLVQLTGTTRVRTPLLDTAAGVSMTISPTLDLILNPGSGLVRMASGDAIQASSYASQTTGWRITDLGEGDFRYLFADEMHVKSFIADLEQALAGGQIIAKSVAVVAVAFTLPAAGATGTLRVRDLPSAPNMAVFQTGDFVAMRVFSRASGSLTVGWAWGTVTAYADQTDGTQTWTFTRHATAGAATGVIPVDALVLDFGVSGNGFYEVNAIDGAYGLNSPYAQVVTWQTHPATQTVRARFGNLRGITNVANEFGLFAGNGTTVTSRYFRASSEVVELRNVPLALYDGANNTVLLSAGSSNNAPSFAMGSPLPTAPLTNSGIWMGLSGGAYQFRVGTITTGALAQGIHWDGTNLTVRGTVVITGSFSGVNYAGASTPGGAANSIAGQGALATANSANWATQVAGTGKPADNATVGAAWATNLTGRPTELTDGRIPAALNSSGIVVSRVDPGVNWGANPGAGYAGLLLGGDYMGYWTGTAWRTYMDNAGRFYVNAGAGSNYMAWNGTTLTINGAIVIQSGSSGIGSFSDAGALATQSSVTWSTQVTGTGKPADNATVGAAWGTNLTGRPAELTDGRITTAISSGGIIQSRVDPGVNWGANPGAGYAGLLLGADYMGYWTGTAWRTYMDSAGRFYVNAGAGSNYMSWDGTTLTVSGAINVVSGNAATTTALSTGLAGKADTNLANSGISTLINGASIRVGSGTKNSNLNGWNIDSGEIVAQTAGVTQVHFNTSSGIGLLATTTEPTAPEMRTIDWGTAFPITNTNRVAGIRAYKASASHNVLRAFAHGYLNGDATAYFGVATNAGVYAIGLMVRTSFSGGNSVTLANESGTTTLDATTILLNANVRSGGTIGTSWTTLTLTSPWGNNGSGWATAQYAVFGDWVVLRGLVLPSSNQAANATIATLVADLRPSVHQKFATTANNLGCSLDVLSTGIVRVSAAVNANQVVSINCVYKR